MEGTKNTGYALVTGASQGIGRAIAMELAKRKFNLVLIALSEHGLEKTAASAREMYGIDALCHEVNLTKQEEIDGLLNWLQDLEIDIKIWVNNAGVGYQGAAHSFAPAFLNKLLYLNINALAALSLWFVNELKRKNQTGYLMNVGSMASFFSLPNKTFYSASKSFVLDFSRSLRQEVKHDGIHVSCLCPGPVKTNEKVSQRINNAGWLAKLFISTPEKIAEIAVKEMLNKKGTIITSIGNKFLWAVSGIVPKDVIQLFTNNIFKARGRVATVNDLSIDGKPANIGSKKKEYKMNDALVFTCSGCSEAGYTAHKAGCELDRKRIVEMSCLAGVAAEKPLFLRKLQNRKAIVIDGCPIECGRGVFKKLGLPVDRHIQLVGYGIKKFLNDPTKEKDVIKSVLDNVKPC